MMKKVLFALMMTMIMSTASVFAAGIDECAGNEVKLQIDNPMMNACGVVKEVDEGRGTVPVIDSDYTLVPIRAVIEAFGGYVGWDGDTRQVSVSLRDNTAQMTIDSTEAVVYADGEEHTAALAVAPKIINGRTMVPLRFVSESVGLKVDWNGGERVITITQPKSDAVSFENVEGEFYPIEDLFKTRMMGKDNIVYTHNGENHNIVTNIVSTEAINWDDETVFDFYDPEASLSSIKVDGEEYSIPNVFNLEYVGIADLNSNDKNFEIVVIDSGVSEDYSVRVFSYCFVTEQLLEAGVFGGMTYEYYGNGTGTVYCDGNGNIVNDYIGFTQPMYAFSVSEFESDEVGFGTGTQWFEPEVMGKELVFGRDLYAYYIAVDEYPESFNDVWQYSVEELRTVEKGTPVIIDELAYIYDEETGEAHRLGYYVRIDGQKYVMQLQYAG